LANGVSDLAGLPLPFLGSGVTSSSISSDSSPDSSSTSSSGSTSFNSFLGRPLPLDFGSGVSLSFSFAAFPFLDFVSGASSDFS
jgi:hypothetical protein